MTTTVNRLAVVLVWCCLMALTPSVEATATTTPNKSKHSKTVREWTFINYYATNNFLEAYSFVDLAKFTGGHGVSDAIASQWLLDTQTQGTYRVSIDHDTWAPEGGFGMARIAQPNMSDPSVLRAHIHHVLQEFPASHYVFFYSGHSSGWYVMTEDTSNMGVVTIQQILAETGIVFDVMVFDSCLMSMLEAMYQFRNVARHALVCETYGPWQGFMSDQLLLTFDDQSIPIKDKLIAVANNFIGRNAAGPDIADVAVNDLSGIQALGDFILSLNLTIPDFQYGHPNNTVEPTDDTHDLWDVITSLPPTRLSAAQRSKFETLFQNVVVYYAQNNVPGANGSEWYNPYHHGLSICRTPVGDPDAAPLYYQLDLQPVAQNTAMNDLSRDDAEYTMEVLRAQNERRQNRIKQNLARGQTDHPHEVQARQRRAQQPQFPASARNAQRDTAHGVQSSGHLRGRRVKTTVNH